MFHNNPRELENELGLSTTPNSPMAILPVLKHPRMTGQQSCFTIHPKPDNSNKIPDLIKEENMLTRYIIPKDLKNQFTRHLNSLGISYSTLFPDFESCQKI